MSNSMFIGRTSIVGIVLAALVLTLVAGCGGGNGPVDDNDLQNALDVPLPSTPAPGSEANVALLEAWEQEENLPQNEDDLREEIRKFIAAANADPNDAAAQLGLVFTILALASHQAADAVGEDLFEWLGISDTLSLAFNPAMRLDKIAAQGLQTASLRGIPRLPNPGTGTSGQAVRPAALPPVSDLEAYQDAVHDYLLPALADVCDRLAAIADGAADSTVLVSLDVDGDTYTLYAADFEAMTAAMQLVRAVALMVDAVNPNYGSYNWDLDLVERDTNSDRVLTVAEYAPAAPFGNLNSTSWSGAGVALAAGVDRSQNALERRQADSDEALNKALWDVDVGSLSDYLDDAADLLAGQVTSNVLYSIEHPTPSAWENGEMEFPLNLRQLWQDPPASLRDLLPSLQLIEMWPDEWMAFGMWDTLPDKTFSGMFPDTDKLKFLFDGAYGSILIQYGSIEIPLDYFVLFWDADWPTEPPS